MNQEIRNKLRNVVTQCRKLLEESVSQELEGKYGIFAKKDQVTADPNAEMTHLTEEEQAARRDILDHFGHIKARDFKPREALDQLVREIAFTHLNRLCAYKMMEAEAREVYVGGQKFREAVSRGINSNGVKFYLADHPEEERLFNTGHQDVAYRHFLDWLGGLLSDEIGVLFNPNDPANRLYPRQKTLDGVLDLLNDGGIKPEEAGLREQWPTIWSQDETIGWVYQYFTPKELRDQARSGNKPPANSYELAFRNQFFTPRYVVEFLTDNTLGRIWYEMQKGNTKLKDQCRYMVRRPIEVFLKEGEQPPKDTAQGRDDLSQEELLKLPVHIPHRPKRDPRELKILDPASGSGHFLLYCFDLLLTIYEEAYTDPELGPALQKEKDYPTLEALRRDVPRLILAHNVHGIDIDLRCSQIAALALWLRCQRAYQEMGLKKERPKITRSNFVCAEPMPGEEQMLKEFVGQLEPKVLGQVVEVVFEKMKLAGEAGSLLKIEDEIRDAVAAAKKQWVRETSHATDQKGQSLLFTEAEMGRLTRKANQPSLFDLSNISDDQFFEQAEAKVIELVRHYSEKSHSGQHLQRRLFTEDTVRGFSFVDLCHKRYDVVLMNPPFGDGVSTTRDYIATRYPSGKGDICAAVVTRGIDLLVERGRVGAITTRTALFVQTFGSWRETILGANSFRVVSDLGYGVLDAMVETAMYVIEKGKIGSGVIDFIRALTSGDKQMLIRQAACDPMHQFRSASIQDTFRRIPTSPMAYWIPDRLLKLFAELPSFNSREGRVCVGVQTGDNFRFLRLAWEVPPLQIDSKAPLIDARFKASKWLRLAKGGEYAPYWDDIHLVMLWQNQGAEIVAHKSSRPQNVRFFFGKGGNYPYRTTSGFALRCLPSGCGFSDGGWGVFPPNGFTCEDLLAFYNSRVSRYFMEVLLGQGDSSVSGSAARNHVAEAVGGVPWLPKPLSFEIRRIVREVISHWRTLSADETCSSYSTPLLKARNGSSFNEALLFAWHKRLDTLNSIAEASKRIEDAVINSFNLEADELRFIVEEEGLHPCDYPAKPGDAGDVISLFTMDIGELIAKAQGLCGSRRYIVKKAFYVDRAIDLCCHLLQTHPTVVITCLRQLPIADIPIRRLAAEEMVSLGVGCVFGRWDVRVVSGQHQPRELPDPFDPLPICSPEMLLGDDGLPLSTAPESYPLRIASEGVLVDDPDRDDDIIRRVRDVLEVIWIDRASSIEKETCDVLGVRELRDYFRKPGKDGFWDDHVGRYSKSRRNAPIYWLLQSSRKNYGLWLYYHRLDKDLLFKALVNHIEPKIRLETSRLESLRIQKGAAGESGKEAKRVGKEIEKQEDFLSELRDFEEKLRQAANLHLVPDLNDGVVLNIAPLWELVPWKEAKNYWDELLKGEYEWSSIGKQLRQKGLVA